MYHLLLILEFGASMLPFTLQTMESIHIQITVSDLRQIIPKDSVLEMIQHRTKHELPSKYPTMLSEWGNKIYSTLSNNKIFPKDCDTQKIIIGNRYPSIYESLFSVIISNHPNNFTRHVYIISAPPTQLKAGDPISKYFHIYKYYLEMRSYLNNHSTNLNYID